MALHSQAQLLDELMGKNRNSGPGIKISAIRYDDEDVCKWMLCGFCPHDLFVNTRADLGPCDKNHDEELRNQYEKSSKFGRLGYEEEFEEYVRSLLNDVERKIRRGNERLKLTQSESNVKTSQQLRQEKLVSLKDELNELIKEAERLGEEGKIDEAQTILETADKIRAECKLLESQIEQGSLTEQKQMEVCEVCGSFLVINDAQSRIDEHISGKQHMGYSKLRAALDEIKKKRVEEKEKRDKERREREKEKEKERSRRDEKSREKSHREREGSSGRRRRHSRSPSVKTSSSSSRKSDSKHRRSKSKEKDGLKLSASSSSSSSLHKRARSRSKSKERNGHKSSSHRDKERARRVDEHRKNGRAEANSDEPCKKQSKNENGIDLKNKISVKNEEEEEKKLAEAENDTDMDEGEIRGA